MNRAAVMLAGALRIAGMLVVLLAAALVLAVVPAGMRSAVVSRCARALCAVLGVRIRADGRPGRSRALIVANHVSWLDALVLAAQQPARFIAKREVRSWPLLGGLVARAGCCFVDRERPFSSYRSLPEVAEALRGGSLVLFGEGTTSHGDDCLPMRTMMMQPAAGNGVPFQPVMLRYRDRSGQPSAAAAFVGDDTFAESLARIVASGGLDAEVRWLAPFGATDRKLAAQRCRSRIRRELLRTAIHGVPARARVEAPSAAVGAGTP